MFVMLDHLSSTCTGASCISGSLNGALSCLTSTLCLTDVGTLYRIWVRKIQFWAANLNIIIVNLPIIKPKCKKRYLCLDILMLVVFTIF